MAFPKAEALQCIPDFNGTKDELDAFIYHVDHFAAKIPAGEPHDDLIYVVLLKLKGKAAAAIRRINATTWPDVKLNLIKELGDNTPVEVALRKINMLRQEPSEPFHEYRMRVLALKSEIQTYNDNGVNCRAMDKNLRLHCIGGLRNRQLVQMAQSQRELSLEELLEYLEEQYAECEEISGINQRIRELEQLHARPQGKNINFRQNNWGTARSGKQQRNNWGSRPSSQFNNPQNNNWNGRQQQRAADPAGQRTNPQGNNWGNEQLQNTPGPSRQYNTPQSNNWGNRQYQNTPTSSNQTQNQRFRGNENGNGRSNQSWDNQRSNGNQNQWTNQDFRQNRNYPEMRYGRNGQNGPQQNQFNHTKN